LYPPFIVLRLFLVVGIALHEHSLIRSFILTPPSLDSVLACSAVF
jgi:hypothetical protein